MTGTGAALPAIDPSLKARFAQELERLLPEGGRIGLAVSGGADSLAMLLLGEAAIPGRIEVASVDHGLRAASAAECAGVAAISAARRLPCAVLKVDVAPGNLQAQARAARYAALAAWARRRGLSAIATAHHADDQAETLLMRLNRGSGVAGLAGVRGRGVLADGGLPLLRPLLGFRRAELALVVENAGLRPVNDPSNADRRFDRVRMRQELADCAWLDPAMLAASAAHLADADDALAWAAARAWGECVTWDGDHAFLRPDLPRAILMRIVERIVRALGGGARGKDVARLIDTLESGGSGNIGGVLAISRRDGWAFRPEPPRRS